MTDRHPAKDPSDDPQISLKKLPSAAYVYPIKSLLSGQIKPAEERPSISIQTSDSTPDVPISYERSPLADASPRLSPSKSPSPNGLNGSIRSSWSDRDLQSQGKQTSSCRSSRRRDQWPSSATSEVHASPEPLQSAKFSRSSRSYSPNFSHYQVDEPNNSPELACSPSGQPMNFYQPEYRSEKSHDRQHEAGMSLGSSSAECMQRKASPSRSLPLATEFVHLPPLTIPSSAHTRSDDDMLATPMPRRSSSAPAISREESLEPSLAPISPSGSATNSRLFSGSSATSETVDFRVEHIQDDNGNHVIVGREGELQKCEDEPICTPGSVQAFGVLIAVQETEDTLVVRQVSENSTELLGLSPRHLFCLECFTDILPQSQANQLWEHIPYLTDTNDDENSGPQVFLISGWGEPGTGTSGPDSTRCSWTCWCAIHRPNLTSDSSSPMSDLIIMEFELERDLVNPLYPPVQAVEGSVLPLPCRTSVSGSLDLGLDRRVSKQVYVSPKPTEHGLEGDEEWLPSPEDIVESTTPHSKPIPALERIRKMTKSTPSSILTGNSPRRRLQRRRPATGTEHLSFTMMDMFAVLSQINEQLGAVDSLELFLKVVVGVIKDLTEFHRVMVYQFDESWSGQVVAELVDWTQTKDLYRGLHFPASDIPAQARALYAINKVRILYDRSQTTARIVVKSKADLEVPLTGYIVSNTDDLLGLFDADSGILVIGEGAKIIGDNQHGQETLIMAEYLRLKKFKGQPREVRWAGKPYKDGHEHQRSLEPRKSFKSWSEVVAGRSRAWTDEQLETAGVLALVYGKASTD
ncbi:hypothetical protein C0991_001938 [Blastosporella zonata]|nr:hypothetical protein C0991_001938 [Blastosporella zonata]